MKCIEVDKKEVGREYHRGTRIACAGESVEDQCLAIGKHLAGKMMGLPTIDATAYRMPTGNVKVFVPIAVR